ncbi:MAG: IPT/TIG domain-containing protein, partial [bacterium]|nr:IPT/TIG domain-containing protein [bacterium]
SGTQVTITGTGFTSTGNTVIFGTSTINNLNSSSNTIIFTVSNLTPPGVYQVLVTNANGKSNAMTFTVTSLLPIGTPILISGGTTGTLRNNFSGWVGFKFKVGSTSLSVSQLGRYVVKGSIGSHTVKLVAISGVSSGTDVPGGSVIVKTYGAKAETYAYTSLVFPVTLQANTTYMLVSQEIIGGDQWYDYLHNVITLTNDATPINAVWALNNTHTYNFTYTWPQTYGPVNLRYSTIGIVPPPPLPPPPPPPLPPPLPLPVTR